MLKIGVILPQPKWLCTSGNLGKIWTRCYQRGKRNRQRKLFLYLSVRFNSADWNNKDLRQYVVHKLPSKISTLYKAIRQLVVNILQRTYYLK